MKYNWNRNWRSIYKV